jgi:hypothetical protein
MTVYALPSWHSRYFTNFEIDLLENVMVNRSKLNFATQTVEFPGDCWVVGFEYRGMPLSEYRSVRAFWLTLRTKAHRVRVWVADHSVPTGTLRGSPTLTALHGEGANAIGVQTTTGSTLLTGDFVGVTLNNNYQQLVLIHNAFTVGSVITAEITPPLRRAANGGAIVTWSKPYLDCMIVERPTFHTRGNMGEGFTVGLIEVPMR